MKAEIVERLPDQVRALLTELEEFANLSIGIELNTEPVSPTDPNPTRSAVRISHNRATIYVHSADVSSNSILHELLHVQRYWIEKVPLMRPLDESVEDNWKVTTLIEDSLEHLIIVPREADYAYEPFSYWNRTVEVNWQNYPWPGDTKLLRRYKCLLGWLSCCSLVTDEGVKSHVESCIRKDGMLSEAERFRKKIDRTINRKPSALSATLRFLKIPRTEVKLIRFDVQNRQLVEGKIPLI